MPVEDPIPEFDRHEEIKVAVDRLLDELPERERTIISDEVAAIVDKFGDDRRTAFGPFEGDMSEEDFITEQDVVVTITKAGYAKSTQADLYRSQRRGGRWERASRLRA